MIPCQKVIGKACFKAFPEFARRAIAYRLLHLLIPTDIAKLLPIKLSDPLIAPGVTIPLDAKFPPGTCIIPGCDFPAGWDPDQEPPACAKSRPLPPIAMVAGGGNPNVFTSPGEPAASQVHPPVVPPVKEEPWFYDDFDNFTDGNWNDDSYGSGSAAIVSGKLQLKATGTNSAGIINRTDPQGGISDFDLSFKQTYVTYIDESYVQFFSGAYYLQIIFQPPDEVLIYPQVTGEEVYVGNYIGATDTWRLEVRAGKVSVYRNNILKIADFALVATPNLPGKMELLSSDDQVILLDDFTITEK